MTCWRTKWDSNWRYNSENISLRCRPNFRSCAAKWPAEKNRQKGARIWFAPRPHGPVLEQGNGPILVLDNSDASCGRLVGDYSLTALDRCGPPESRARDAVLDLALLAPGKLMPGEFCMMFMRRRSHHCPDRNRDQQRRHNA